MTPLLWPLVNLTWTLSTLLMICILFLKLYGEVIPLKFLNSAPAWLVPVILKIANFLLHWLFISVDIYIDHDSVGCPYCEFIKEVIE